MDENIAMLFGGGEVYKAIIDKKEFLEFAKAHKKDLEIIKGDIEKDIKSANE